MTKEQAIKAFGSGTKLADALGVTRQAVSMWPDELSQRQTDEIVGAAVRLGIEIPEEETAA